MARYLGPKKKILRRFGMIEDRKTNKKYKRKADYGLMLEEKQKLKFIYGIMEKQMRSYFEKSKKISGNPTDNLLILLELAVFDLIF